MNKFAFIAHPINLPHIYEIFRGFRRGAALLLQRNTLKELLAKSGPIKFADCRNIKSVSGATAYGEGILCSLLPDQFVSHNEEFVLNKIAQAVAMAEELGAKIATLGGFNSVIGNEGGELEKRFKSIALTSGNTCTAALVIKSIIRASDMLDLDLKNSTLTIIGATGDIGSICAKVFSKKVKVLHIVARKQDRLLSFCEVLKKHSSACIKVFKRTSEAIKTSDIILSTTSSLTTLIDPLILKPGAIVCDVSIPSNIPAEILNLRNDVLVFEGGLAKFTPCTPIKAKHWNRLLPWDRVYGCLTEAIVLTFENRFENYSIGRGNITEEKIREMTSLLRKHSFEVSDFFCGSRFYSNQDIENIKISRMGRLTHANHV
ncbi:MAG: hypothetical protein HQ579_09140 [Candidatus Omnitrophica bacterium]|nr:hypothetical protein [Candidatus Omnitrophota bacterium]